MTTEEGNKLIAEFMNLEVSKGLLGDTDIYYKIPFYHDSLISAERNFLFHISWDWLMPVCQKINSRESIKTCDSNGVKNSIICYINAIRPMKRGLLKMDIEQTFDGAIQFIQWLNNKNK